MSLDFQQVQQQVHQLGQAAITRQTMLHQRLDEANGLLDEHAQNLDALRVKVQRVVENYDAVLRCAVPVGESLDTHHLLPALPDQATILAADGSQIFADRHAQIEYGLVNVGAIQMSLHSHQPPVTKVSCRLIYHEQVEAMSEGMLSLERDLSERKYLVELISQTSQPVITITDGPLELWVAKGEGSEEAQKYQQSLEEYLQVLTRLFNLNVTTAGYVDKPGSDLVVRMLEVVKATDSELPTLRRNRPLRGVTDRSLFYNRLAPGERSAVFAIQSQFAQKYAGPLALHFFYLNVGLHSAQPHMARVEIPAWVAESPPLLDGLHAVLIDQCCIMGQRPYPYLLHRAHETAVVTREDQEQVTQMILHELQRLGLTVESQSYKQVAKDLAGRTRYSL